MNGVINVYKNRGMTSFDVVRRVKKIANTGKVGHTGTLDPEASGVLPICIGKATKIIDYIMDSIKVYEVEFKLGVKTDTYDIWGKVLEETNVENIDPAVINGVIEEFVGDIIQVPPMFSALKQNGVRLYELARKGIEVEREGRNITIYDICDVKINFPYVSMKVTCSKGTYIRSLCYDIGEKLSVGATMTSLNRSQTSVFSQEKSINIDELDSINISEYIISVEDALKSFDKVIVSSRFSKLLINGVKVFDRRLLNTEVQLDKLYRVYDDTGLFIGLGKKDKDGFKIEKLLLN